jgi:hypothetical protein
MSKVPLEQVIEEAKSLTLEEQHQLREAMDKEARTAELRRIQDKYATVPSSSEEFAAHKAEEIMLEDRH